MEACVIGKAGKDDISMIMNFFVISKVRQAYEFNEGSIMRAREWIESGQPITEKTIFGITDFSVRILSDDGKNASLEANYILWVPGSNSEEITIMPIERHIIRDQLKLSFKKDAWQIAEIIRN